MFGRPDLSNYPPGVTGNEYEINGPDKEEEYPEKQCPNGHVGTFKLWYRYESWFVCATEDCTYQTEPFDEDEDEPDWDARIKDRKIDENT